MYRYMEKNEELLHKTIRSKEDELKAMKDVVKSMNALNSFIDSLVTIPLEGDHMMYAPTVYKVMADILKRNDLESETLNTILNIKRQ